MRSYMHHAQLPNGRCLGIALPSSAAGDWGKDLLDRVGGSFFGGATGVGVGVGVGVLGMVGGGEEKL